MYKSTQMQACWHLHTFTVYMHIMDIMVYTKQLRAGIREN